MASNERTSLDVSPWLNALHRIQLIPVAENNGALGVGETLNMLGCSAESLDELVRSGLPAIQVAAHPRFDSRDIFNLAFYSSVRRSVPRLTLAVFARMAREEPEHWLDERRWSATVKLSCPAGQECPGGQWTLALPSGLPGSDSTLAELAGQSGSASLTFNLTTRGTRCPLVSPELQEAYRAVSGGLRFQLVPRDLKTDVDAIAKAGIADCDGFSEVLAAQCRDAGYGAEVERGLVLVPFGFGHHAWTVVQDDDGQWKSLDPTLPALARLGGTDVAAFREACGGWRLNRVARCEQAQGTSIAWHTCAAHRDGSPELAIKITRG